MRASLRIAIAAGLFVALPIASHATVQPEPVLLHVAGPAPVFRPGEPATLRFEMLTKADVQVSNVSVESASLARPFSMNTASLLIKAGTPEPFALDLLPTGSPAPLVIRYEVDGKPYERTVDLASRMEGEIAKRSQMVQVAPPTGKAPSAALVAEADSVRRARELSGQSGTLIFYSGRLVYTRRGDGSHLPIEMGAWGVRVSLMDEDYGPDDDLGDTYTDLDGNFFSYVYWDGQLLEGDPELYIHFETDHPWVVVQEGFWDVEYSWDTATRGSSTADVDIGTYRPSDTSTYPALQIAGDIARDHELYRTGDLAYFVPGVDVKWPDGDNAYFDPFFEQIHIGHATEWDEGVHSHEYGHFFVYTFSASESPSYCNGYCDVPSCGHCLWCQEGSNEAYSEGWADWISMVQTAAYPSTYGIGAVHRYNFETILPCGQAGNAWTDAERTEGNFAATLQDIWDSGPNSGDMDPNGLGGYRDRLELGVDEIFQVLDVDEPTNSRAFLTKLRDRFPQYRAQLWEAGMNNRWDLDQLPPGPPTNLASSSHPVGVSTGNLNVTLTWTQPGPDDWSGILGYSIAFASSPVAPDATIEAPATGLYVSEPLAAGTYYATVGTVDRSGRVSDTYATYGPFGIVTPTPVDLAPYVAPGWARPLVARATGDATSGSVPNPPALLPGNGSPTYLNGSGRNQGQTAHTGFLGIRTGANVDGYSMLDLGYFHPDAPGAAFSLTNQPVTVRGGRHTVDLIIDNENAWWESNESNNHWAHPWVWNPLPITANTPVRRMKAPPNPTGSWSSVVDGSPLYYNCDGLRFSNTGWWNAVWVAADADTEDYGIRLHAATSSPDAGFDVVLGSANAPAGYIDAVVVNTNTLLTTNWDVGVINDFVTDYNVTPQSSFVVKQVTSTSFAYGDTAAVAFPDSEYVLLKEVYVPAPGATFVTVWADSASHPIHVAWLDRTFTRGALNATEWTWPEGRVTIEGYASAPGYHCVALTRDPKDGRGAWACTLGVGLPTCDMVAFRFPAWSGPLVPRNAPDGTPSTVPAPDTLDGGLANTFINFGYRNISVAPVPMANVGYELTADGAPIGTGVFPGLDSYNVGATNNVGPFLLRGGRHTLAVRYDPANLLPETWETNNTWGEQWVWSPALLGLGGGISGAPAPPEPFGGITLVSTSDPLYLDCLGFRAPFGAGSGLWGVVGILPADSSDDDLRLHEPAPGTRDGFGASLGISTWGRAESDYLVVRHDGARTLDASVIRGDDGPAGAFDIAAAGSPAPAPPPFTANDQFLGTSEVVRLHPVVLAAGDYRVRLTNVDGALDWGIAVHGDSALVQTKSQALAASWYAGPGGNEELYFHVAVPDTFVVAVWKRNSAGRGQWGIYRLEVQPVTLDSPVADAPVATRMAAPRPAPFRDRTTLAFDLAIPGDARLEVFDLRGARDRTLVSGRLGAGHHEVEWRGEDDGGRRLPAGVYLLRLEAGGVVARQKVVKVE